MKDWIKVGVCSVALSLGAFACGGAGEGDGTEKGSLDISSFGNDDGKGDLAKSTKLLDNVPPDAAIQGRFDPRLRTYGYVIEARKGAKITINLEATAGKDARGVEEGAELDMIYEVYELHGLEQVGILDGVKERFYAVTLDRRIRHPVVDHLTQHARRELEKEAEALANAMAANEENS